MVLKGYSLSVIYYYFIRPEEVTLQYFTIPVFYRPKEVKVSSISREKTTILKFSVQNFFFNPFNHLVRPQIYLETLWGGWEALT